MIERLDVPVPGGTLATFRLGSGGEPVLAVHGITATNRCWLAVSRALGAYAVARAAAARGPGAVAQAIVRALQSPPSDPALRSA